MNKFLRYSFVALMAIIGLNINAQEVTIDFDNDYKTLFPTIKGESSGTGDSYVADGEFNETTTSTAVSGVTVTVTASATDAKTRNRIWSSSPRLRMYDGTITIKAGQNFKKLTMNIKTNNSLVAKENTVNDGTLNFEGLTSATGTIVWEGEANEVIMTIAGNTQFKSIVVSFDGGSGGDPVIPDPDVTTTGQGTLESPYTVADALAVAGLLEQGKTGTQEYYIKGKISSITFPYDTQHGTATFNISDDGQAANEFLCYGVKFLENKAWLDGNTQIAVGDEVIVYGKLKNYQGTLETASGAYLYSLNGVTQNTGGQEEAATQIASIAALLALESPSNNLELTLTDAKVLFVDNNYIYMRENGKALCFYKIEGLIDAVKNNYLVNGKIIVDYEVYKNLPEVKANAKTNLDGLSFTESEEEAVPVQTTIADVAAGANVCDLVKLTGTLKKEANGTNTTYKLSSGDTEIVAVNNGKGLDKIDEGTEITVVGIVNTNNSAYQIKLTKSVNATGVSNIKADQLKNAPAYNVAGQRVNEGYKGLIIKGGVKVIQK